MTIGRGVLGCNFFITVGVMGVGCDGDEGDGSTRT